MQSRLEVLLINSESLQEVLDRRHDQDTTEVLQTMMYDFKEKIVEIIDNVVPSFGVPVHRM